MFANSDFSLHDFRMVFGEKRTNVLFDVAVPYEYMEKKEEISKHLEKKISGLDEKYCAVITVEPTI